MNEREAFFPWSKSSLSELGWGVHLINSDCTDFSRAAKQHRQHRPQE